MRRAARPAVVDDFEGHSRTVGHASTLGPASSHLEAASLHRRAGVHHQSAGRVDLRSNRDVIGTRFSGTGSWRTGGKAGFPVFPRAPRNSVDQGVNRQPAPGAGQFTPSNGSGKGFALRACANVLNHGHAKPKSTQYAYRVLVDPSLKMATKATTPGPTRRRHCAIRCVTAKLSAGALWELKSCLRIAQGFPSTGALALPRGNGPSCGVENPPIWRRRPWACSHSASKPLMPAS